MKDRLIINGEKYKLMENTRPISDCGICSFRRTNNCLVHRRCKERHCYKKIEEKNNMKLEELKFKTITGTAQRNRVIQEALFKKGGSWWDDSTCISDLRSFCLSYNQNSDTKSKLTCQYKLDDYLLISAPEFTFQQVLYLIEQVEFEPKFDIKFQEDILCRDSKNEEWVWNKFGHISKKYSFFRA